MLSVKLVDRLSHKYQLTTVAISNTETDIRNGIDSLWMVPNKTFNILRACADAEASAPKNDQEKLAVKGYQFCHQLVQIVDYLKAHRNTLPLKTIKQALDQILGMIKTNMSGELQFPHVSELIFQIMAYGKKHDRKIREQEYAKARKGLSRLASIALDLVNKINKLGGAEEAMGRFDPKGAKLSESEIMSFIRQHGSAYGIPDLETWSLVLNADPELEKPLTTVVHALSRGHSPVEASYVRAAVFNILARHHELNQPTNTPALEQENSPTSPILLDEKTASKYGDRS